MDGSKSRPHAQRKAWPLLKAGGWFMYGNPTVCAPTCRINAAACIDPRVTRPCPLPRPQACNHIVTVQVAAAAMAGPRCTLQMRPLAGYWGAARRTGGYWVLASSVPTLFSPTHPYKPAYLGSVRQTRAPPPAAGRRPTTSTTQLCCCSQHGELPHTVSDKGNGLLEGRLSGPCTIGPARSPAGATATVAM